MDARHVAGTVLGIALTAACMGLVDGASQAPRRHLLADDAGSLSELVIHYVPTAAELSPPVYRDLLRALPDDVVVWVVVPDLPAFDDLVARVGAVGPTLVPVPVGHAMTTWSRDRWLALAPVAPGDPVTILAPMGEDGDDQWPARAGDRRTGQDLAGRPFVRASFERSALYFDGGDFVADAETVFVTPRVLRRSGGRVVAGRDQLRWALEVTLGKRVVLLDEAPEHHAGMFMMPLGGRRMLVGDPSLAAALVADPEGLIPAGGGPDFSAALQAQFDAVAAQVEAAGYTVTRVPIVPGRDGRTWWTWLNGLLETRDGVGHVYMPTFDAPAPLRDAAEAVWRDAGYTVHAVDATSAYTHFGSLRCLVNVLRRRG